MKSRKIKNSHTDREMLRADILILIIAVGVFFLLKGFNLESRETNIEAFAQTNMTMITKADELAASYYYDEAIDLLKSQPKFASEETTQKIEEITNEKNALVKYEGDIHHVFFHSLIIYPKLAFNGGFMEQGFNMWMTTVSEFKAMLPQLYERGYVLYDIENLEEPDPQNPALKKKKDIMLPEGKKPLIISVDDVNYYNYMAGYGFAEKLVLDEKGEVATQVKTPEGETVVTRDGDVVPILEDFVKEHPDFSYRGARGILATTGYEGAFGYRITDVEGKELEAMLNDLKPIVQKLKETGWKIACHSYTHNDYFKDGTVSLERLQYDTKRWQETIGEMLGKTRIYISPFGYKLKADEPRYRYLVEEDGFDIFCFVGMGAVTNFNPDNLYQGRFDLDGFQMMKNTSYINKNYFNVDEVMDKTRPKLY